MRTRPPAPSSQSLATRDIVGHLPLPLVVAGHDGSTVPMALNGMRLLRRSAWQR